MKYRINISQNSNFLEIAKADNAFREDSNKLLITILIFSIFSLPFILYFIREREFSIGLGGFTIVFGFFISMLIKNYRKLKLERAKGLVIRFNKTDSSFVINGSQNYTFQEIRRIIIEYHYNDGNMILSYSLYLNPTWHINTKLA